MTAIETVWNQMKACAADCAARGEQPRLLHAEAIVTRFMQEARVSPWPPPKVIRFYAEELIDMAARYRARRPQEAAG